MSVPLGLRTLSAKTLKTAENRTSGSWSAGQFLIEEKTGIKYNKNVVKDLYYLLLSDDSEVEEASDGILGGVDFLFLRCLLELAGLAVDREGLHILHTR